MSPLSHEPRWGACMTSVGCSASLSLRILGRPEEIGYYMWNHSVSLALPSEFPWSFVFRLYPLLWKDWDFLGWRTQKLLVPFSFHTAFYSVICSGNLPNLYFSPAVCMFWSPPSFPPAHPSTIGFWQGPGWKQGTQRGGWRELTKDVLLRWDKSLGKPARSSESPWVYNSNLPPRRRRSPVSLGAGGTGAAGGGETRVRSHGLWWRNKGRYWKSMAEREGIVCC